MVGECFRLLMEMPRWSVLYAGLRWKKKGKGRPHSQAALFRDGICSSGGGGGRKTGIAAGKQADASPAEREWDGDCCCSDCAGCSTRDIVQWTGRRSSTTIACGCRDLDDAGHTAALHSSSGRSGAAAHSLQNRDRHNGGRAPARSVSRGDGRPVRLLNCRA